MPSAQTLERFITRVESNAHVQAIEEFYTEDASMRENMECTARRPRRAGSQRAGGYAGARALGAVALRAAGVRRRRPGGGALGSSGLRRQRRPRARELEELAYQRWEGERIAQEQFFYDPSQFVWRDAPGSLKRAPSSV